MSTSFRNSSFNSNFNRETLAVLPSELDGDTIEIQFPTQLIGAVDFRNNQTSTIDSYAASKKSMAQSMFNSRKNNTIYIEQPSLAASTSNRLDKVYFKQAVDNDMKAKYVAQAWREMYNKSEMKAKDVSRENNGNFEQGNTKEVDRYFEKAKAAMTGPPRRQEKFKRPNYDQENDHVGVQNIHRGAVGETGILNNRANIRTVMGNRSMENQERIQAEKAAKAKLLALHEAQKMNIERQEEVKGVKFADAQNLSNSWKIPNTDKLKKVVQSESIKKKNAAKEEARKNSKKTTQNTLTRKPTKTDNEVLRASSAPKKKPQQTTEEDKKYVFSAKKIKKLPTESQADYKTRVNYTLMALPQQKENLDPVEQHQITKKFHELILKSGVEKNGRITLEAKK